VLPVSFDLAASWRAKPFADNVSTGPLGRQGGLGLRCEIDAKPAGHIGFLRVWVGGKADDDPRKAVDAFLGEEKNVVARQQRAVSVGGTSAVEAAYIVDSPVAGVRKPERILAVPSPGGVVLLALGVLDQQEHEQMLPAYQLASHSLTVSS
jgi:hypothetical protein